MIIFGNAGRADKCKMQNAECKILREHIATNFFVSAFWVVVPKWMREQVSR